MRAVTAAVALCATVLVGCTGNDAGGDHPLTVQIRLSETSVPAGRAISGVAVVTNVATHPLTITDCNGTWIQVGLSNADMSYRAAWRLCRSTTVLQPGTIRIPITVDTTYQRCTPHADSATTEMPACEHGTDAPPLPPGTYNTTTGILEPEGVDVPTPQSVQVTLTS